MSYHSENGTEIHGNKQALFSSWMQDRAALQAMTPCKDMFIIICKCTLYRKKKAKLNVKSWKVEKISIT